MAIQTRKTAPSHNTRRELNFNFKGFTTATAVNAKDRKFFTEQMALLLETGSSMQASLQALQSQVNKPSMQVLIQQLLNDIEQGSQLSAALAQHPQVFSQTYINLIAASEEGGYLHEVLEQLLEMEQKREELKQTMVSALSYPVFLMVFALSVIIFVLVVVFPKFADLFSLIADELPASTVFLMSASELISQHWIILSVSIVGFILLFKFWANTEQGHTQLDWFKLRFPLIRDIFTQLYLVQSLRVLSLSLGNGVNIMASLNTCRDVVDNKIFQRFIRQVENNVEQGKGIAIGFQNTPFIPPVVAQMIKTGEETASLPRVLSRLSSYYEAELSKRLNTLSRLAEPVMLLIMGGVVGLIVSSLILPIFKLSRAVG